MYSFTLLVEPGGPPASQTEMWVVHLAKPYICIYWPRTTKSYNVYKYHSSLANPLFYEL